MTKRGLLESHARTDIWEVPTLAEHQGQGSSGTGFSVEGDLFQVVMNDEEQYSIWAARTPPPPGWTLVGYAGPRAMCLEHIEKVWTDMRPLTVRGGPGLEDR